MTIKEFCEQYSQFTNKPAKDKFIQDNLEIRSYMPFLTKDAIATSLVEQSTYVYDKHTDKDGKVTRTKTDKISVNSTVQYLLFCRIVIENYTNLTVETETFCEEYDLLKQSGLLDLFIGDNGILPMDDIAELRSIVDMHQKDVLFNETTTQAFVEKQMNKLTNLFELFAEPVMNSIESKIEGSPKEDVKNFVESVKNGDFKEV